MSKGIILYQSKYGATKKYAGWLVERIGYDCVETKNAKVADLKNYDVILFDLDATLTDSSSGIN